VVSCFLFDAIFLIETKSPAIGEAVYQSYLLGVSNDMRNPLPYAACWSINSRGVRKSALKEWSLKAPSIPMSTIRSIAKPQKSLRRENAGCQVSERMLRSTTIVSASAGSTWRNSKLEG